LLHHKTYRRQSILGPRRQQAIIDNWDGNSVSDLRKKLIEEARNIHLEDARMCEQISEHGAGLFSRTSTVLTHCNTGMLATGGRGTALGIISKAWELNKLYHVYIDETRPLFQGARLTAWE